MNFLYMYLIDIDLRTFINEVGAYTSSLEEFVNREENLVPLLNLKENELTYNLLIHMWRKYTPNDALVSVFFFNYKRHAQIQVLIYFL
jgi:hypothetical protein